MAGDGRDELVAAQRVQAHRRVRADGRRSWNVPDERDFAEPLAWPEGTRSPRVTNLDI